MTDYDFWTTISDEHIRNSELKMVDGQLFAYLYLETWYVYGDGLNEVNCEYEVYFPINTYEEQMIKGINDIMIETEPEINILWTDLDDDYDDYYFDEFLYNKICENDFVLVKNKKG